MNVPIIKKRKLGQKTVDCVFLGYAIHSVGYRFLVINSRVPDMCVGSIMESRDATSFESEFPMRGNAPSTSGHESAISPDTFVKIEQTTIEDPEIDDNGVTRKSKRQRVAKSFGDDFAIYLVDDTPKTIDEAYSSPDVDSWKETVRCEMDSIMINGPWEVIDRPYGRVSLWDVNGCSKKS